jgi:hypothetical protein
MLEQLITILFGINTLTNQHFVKSKSTSQPASKSKVKSTSGSKLKSQSQSQLQPKSQSESKLKSTFESSANDHANGNIERSNNNSNPPGAFFTWLCNCTYSPSQFYYGIDKLIDVITKLCEQHPYDHQHDHDHQHNNTLSSDNNLNQVVMVADHDHDHDMSNSLSMCSCINWCCNDCRFISSKYHLLYERIRSSKPYRNCDSSVRVHADDRNGYGNHDSGRSHSRIRARSRTLISTNKTIDQWLQEEPKGNYDTYNDMIDFIVHDEQQDQQLEDEHQD